MNALSRAAASGSMGDLIVVHPIEWRLYGDLAPLYAFRTRRARLFRWLLNPIRPFIVNVTRIRRTSP